ncbi:MAG TPA: serine hydrolase domain-containing protein [Anaerolineales bacterium]|nr:serine hydrolase domain-containing protein [Anaerolineales bacterium]
MEFASNILHGSVWREGKPIFEYQPEAGEIFNMASATKSLKSLMIANALQTGLITSIDDPVKIYLPSLPSRFGCIPLQSFLTMTSGIDWPSPQTPAIESSEVVEFLTINKIRIADHQGHFVYKPDSAVVLKLLEAVYGNTIENAFNHLFRPYGLEPIELDGGFWEYQGASSAPKNLHILAGLIRQALAGDGSLFSPGYIRGCFQMQADGGAPEHDGYSYLWWVPDDTKLDGIYAAGFGGQYWFVSQYTDLSIVIFSTQDGPHPENRIWLKELVKSSK